MRKFFLTALLLPCLLLISACSETNPLYEHVSELKENLYQGNAEEVTISASYGFCETPHILDGVTGETVKTLTFTINVIPDEIRRAVKFTQEGNEYYGVFKADVVTGEYKVKTEISVKPDDSFTIIYISGNKETSVKMVSILPKTLIDYRSALDVLLNKQKNLLASYFQNDSFKAEIFMRIFVKEQTPYWYVAICAGENKLKALLIHGVSGELIAVREVM